MANFYRGDSVTILSIQLSSCKGLRIMNEFQLGFLKNGFCKGTGGFLFHILLIS